MAPSDALDRLLARRRFIASLAAGSSVAVFGGAAVLASREAQARMAGQARPDGRPRLPPGQRVLTSLRQMGGTPGDPSRAKFRLKVYGEVAAPFELDFRQLLALAEWTRALDVHCVTGWSLLGAQVEGVQLKTLAQKAKVKPGARHVVFEAAHGYTANAPLREVLAPQNMLAHRLEGQSLAHPHGGPVRGLVPDLYFWRSAEWMSGIRFVRMDDPGYWEKRGYHNHADPWREERHSAG